jgi:hypothetical protein
MPGAHDRPWVFTFGNKSARVVSLPACLTEEGTVFGGLTYLLELEMQLQNTLWT